MKGMVFTEFLEMVEERFGIDMVDDLIERADLPVSQGAYTAVGTYPHEEMVSLVTELHKATEVSVSDLLKTYGEHLFQRFVVGYPVFFENLDSSLAFLENIHDYIHVEVRKLYPDAELPEFRTTRVAENELHMHYISERHMEDFAEGLILGCFKHFEEDGSIQSDKQGDGTTIFVVKVNSVK
ncbi:heme NO-binding domain-containing protein [Rubellicoccus peritrichatus]|uniref:Heme NO-binding domain-containing protein n=1 Tax=Rubellicoccus peritrichatus TaxID=3080537 RepID=A0AAQ3LEA5_9BACT|nr:heme NO-binding domain-containing protein [Puniceicoccus sp. CR14]WOO42013.1 heme NO-binding domain-containing protein [Puniceicoccus sp. CR14]